MTIRDALSRLTKPDIYSLMLFVLFKLKDTNEYSSLSQLSYILDKDNLLKLCEFYGGTTITIPTIEDLEAVFNALLLYQEVNIEKQDFDKMIDKRDLQRPEKRKLLDCYDVVVDVLKNYDFNSGRDNE